MVAIISIVFLVLLIALLVRWAHRSVFFMVRHWSKKVRWRVWSVIDDEKRGAAGAIMEALKSDNNVLFRDHFRGEFKASSLLLSPIPMGRD